MNVTLDQLKQWQTDAQSYDANTWAPLKHSVNTLIGANAGNPGSTQLIWPGSNPIPPPPPPPGV